MGGKGAPREKEDLKKLTLKFSGKAYAEFQELSKRHRRSMTELIRLGVGVVKILLEAAEQNHKVIVATADGKTLKEIVLPQP